MQLWGSARCKSADSAEAGIAQRAHQAACSSLCWDSLGAQSPEQLKTAKEPQTLHAGMHQVPETIHAGGPGTLQLNHVSEGFAVTHLSAQTCCYCSSLWWKMELHTKGPPQCLEQIAFGCSSAEGPEGMADVQGALLADDAEHGVGAHCLILLPRHLHDQLNAQEAHLCGG